MHIAAVINAHQERNARKAIHRDMDLFRDLMARKTID
jgi:hypothetical protein